MTGVSQVQRAAKEVNLLTAHFLGGGSIGQAQRDQFHLAGDPATRLTRDKAIAAYGAADSIQA